MNLPGGHAALHGDFNLLVLLVEPKQVRKTLQGKDRQRWTPHHGGDGKVSGGSPCWAYGWAGAYPGDLVVSIHNIPPAVPFPGYSTGSILCWYHTAFFMRINCRIA